MTHARELESCFRRAPRLIPSGPKDKDFLFKVAAPRATPPALNVMAYVRLRDQLALGSCVGHSIAFAAESIRNKTRLIDEDSDVSRELVYTLAKLESGLLGKGDTGAQIRGGLDGIRKYGVCAERLLPYDLQDWDVMPSQATLDLAAQHKVTLYERIPVDPFGYPVTYQSIKQAITSGLRVIAGFQVPRGMFGIAGPLALQPAQWSWLANSDAATIVGGHAILVGGYDDAVDLMGALLLGNSWGERWGDKGWGLVPVNKFLPLCFELWAVHDFDGYSDVSAEPVLTEERRAQLAEGIAQLGLAEGAVNIPAIYEYLRRRGCSDAQVAQFAHVETDVLTAFKGANAARLAAWTGF